jgi:putative hydrolase of the HAD superfamily
MQHGERIMIYMQKHASMGMTMPHLHIHVLLTPTLEKFSHDILQEFRFLITSILDPEHKNSYAKPPLSDSVMQHRKELLASELSKDLEKQLTTQYQHFTLFSPPRKFLIEKNINAIIFDIGGVLNKGLPDFIKCFNDHGIILTENLLANVECRQLIYNFCTGKYGVHENSARAFFEDIRRKAFVSESTPFEQFKQAWNAAIVSLNYELINQLHLLRIQGYRLFVLSDTNILHCEYGEELYQRQHPNKSFRAIFDKCYFSHETGNYKGFPDHEGDRAWLQIIEENNLQPHECLFIDDKLEYVEKAKRWACMGYILRLAVLLLMCLRN